MARPAVPAESSDHLTPPPGPVNSECAVIWSHYGQRARNSFWLEHSHTVGWRPHQSASQTPFVIFFRSLLSMHLVGGRKNAQVHSSYKSKDPAFAVCFGVLLFVQCAFRRTLSVNREGINIKSPQITILKGPYCVHVFVGSLFFILWSYRNLTKIHIYPIVYCLPSKCLSFFLLKTDISIMGEVSASSVTSQRGQFPEALLAPTFWKVDEALKSLRWTFIISAQFINSSVVNVFVLMKSGV